MDKNQTNKGKYSVGHKLAQDITKKKLNSIKLHSEKLADLQKINSVIFVGSSLTGKTTLVDAIRQAVIENPKLALYISIPKRVVTRPKRENDNLDENDFASYAEFDRMIQNGKIEVHWVRKMEGARTEQYGFLSAKHKTIPVYSANNAVINNRESVQPSYLLNNALIIAVYAPEKIRRERLLKRSSDLINEKPEEVAYRLSDKAANMLSYAHVVVKNFGKNMNRTKKDMVELIRLVVANVN